MDRRIKSTLTGLAALVASAIPLRAETNPEQAEVYVNRSTECLDSRDYDCALENLRLAYPLNPNSSSLHNNIAMYHFKTKNPDTDKIIRHIERAASLDPKDPVIYFNMGLIFRTYGMRSDDPHIKHTYFSRAMQAYERGLSVAEPGSEIESNLRKLTQIMQDKFLD